MGPGSPRWRPARYDVEGTRRRLLRRERVLDGLPLRLHVLGPRLAGNGALDGFLRRLVIEGVDLVVVRGFPVDEHANGDEDIVRLVRGDRAVRDAIGDRATDRRLRGTEHL